MRRLLCCSSSYHSSASDNLLEHKIMVNKNTTLRSRRSAFALGLLLIYSIIVVAFLHHENVNVWENLHRIVRCGTRKIHSIEQTPSGAGINARLCTVSSYRYTTKPPHRTTTPKLIHTTRTGLTGESLLSETGLVGGEPDWFANNETIVASFFPKQQQDAFYRVSDGIVTSKPFWQSVDEDMDVLTYSAHYDDVEVTPVIRVVGVARIPLPYGLATCRYYGCLQCPVMLSVFGLVAHYLNDNGKRYLGAFVVCPLPTTDDVLPFAVTIHKEKRTTGTRPILIYYSNTTLSRQSAYVQRLLQQRSIALEEGDTSVFSTLWKRARYDDKGGLNTRALIRSGEAVESGRIQTTRISSQKTYSQNDLQGTLNTSNSHDTVQSSNIGRDKEGYRWNITRCFPAFQKSYNHHVLLAEMVAASRALGVDHFVFYVESVGPEVKTTLEVLQGQGVAEVLPWNLHLKDKHLFYKGQFPAIQDCMYRQLRASRYVLTADVDELFLPKSHPSLLTLLDAWFNKRPECGAFDFLNTYINVNLPHSPPPVASNTTATTTNKTATTTILYSLARQYGLPMYLHTRRHVEILHPGDRSKIALNPRRVLVGSVHDVRKMRTGFKLCVMKSQEGLLYHYRNLSVPVMEDDSVRRYGESYVKEVIKLLKEVNERKNNFL